jgi:hypothetical protein
MLQITRFLATGAAIHHGNLPEDAKHDRYFFAAENTGSSTSFGKSSRNG